MKALVLDIGKTWSDFNLESEMKKIAIWGTKREQLRCHRSGLVYSDGQD